MVAAGSGVRLGGEVPKALRPLAGEPLIVHALRRLAQAGVTHAVVAIRPVDQALFEQALAGLDLPIDLVPGGAERQDSVREGLGHVTGNVPGARIVLVHDAARPLVDPNTISRVIAAVADGAVAVIPVVPVVDTVRRLTGDGSVGMDRSQLVAVQTPQGFDLATLQRAHEAVAAQRVAVTDDAGACENLGVPITLVEGSPTGLKVTHAPDLAMAEALLQGESG